MFTAPGSDRKSLVIMFGHHSSFTDDVDHGQGGGGDVKRERKGGGRCYRGKFKCKLNTDTFFWGGGGGGGGKGGKRERQTGQGGKERETDRQTDRHRGKRQIEAVTETIETEKETYQMYTERKTREREERDRQTGQ